MPRLPNYDPSEHTPRPEDFAMTRRELLRRTGMGMGTLSLAMLLRENMFTSSASAAEFVPGLAGGASSSPLAPHKPPMAAKAKHVIHIFAGGAPSHVDTFDPKPALSQFEDKSLPGL